MVEMPKDGNGKAIDIETVRVLWGAHGKRFAVDAYVYGTDDGRWSFIDRDGDQLFTSDFTVEPPDSWEKLKRDAFDLSPYDYVKKRGIDADLALGSAMAQDVYRRARALAGDTE